MYTVVNSSFYEHNGKVYRFKLVNQTQIIYKNTGFMRKFKFGIKIKNVVQKRKCYKHIF